MEDKKIIEKIVIYNESKKVELKLKILELWAGVSTQKELVNVLEHGYIFGEFGNDEHYDVKDLSLLVKNHGIILGNKIIVADDKTGLMFLSVDELNVLTKCKVCKKYPCVCKKEEVIIEEV